LDGPAVQEQRRAIESACRRLDLELIDVVRDHEAGGSDGRPGLLYALERIGAEEASCLVVSDLEHLAGSAGELAGVLDRLEQDRGRLVVVDVGLDTATPAGRLAVARRPGVSPLAPRPPARPAAPPEPPPAAAPDAELVRALGYASVADDAGADELETQRQAIEATCGRLGFELLEVVSEREPRAGKALDRAGVSYLIERLAAGDASCLVVSGLDRLSRSVAELGTLVQWLEQSNVRLVALEIDLDTLSPGGRAAARALASVGGWERERLSDRTRKGLAAARAKRHTGGGAADPAGDRRRAQRRGRPHAARGPKMEDLERANRGRLQAAQPRHERRRPPDGREGPGLEAPINRVYQGFPCVKAQEITQGTGT
jgi:DNA invertase Pin-like site-specific DNA recombinase